MRISQISTTKLFGTFNHKINLNLEEKITIIHGPNGVGKTTLLRLVDAIFNKQGDEIRSIPFEKLSVKFDDGSLFTIISKLSFKKIHPEFIRTKDNGNYELKFERIGQKPLSWKSNLRFDSKDFRFPMSYIERLVPSLERIGSTSWKDERTGEVLSLDLVYQKYVTFFQLNLEIKETGLIGSIKFLGMFLSVLFELKGFYYLEEK